jgi:ABC-type transport system involved in multi-copper enzyme maturation permease subunit
MTNEATLASAAQSEWIKFRTVRSTIVGTIVFVVLTIGLGVLVTSLIRANWSTMNLAQQLTIDPVSASLGGLFFGQFAIGVIGSLFITTEYTSGAIRTSLTAVPNRVRLALAKLVVLVISMLVISEIICVAAFLIGMKIFSGVVPTYSLSSGPVLRAVLLAGVYLALLAVFGFSLGLILRQSVACISVFVTLLLILPIIVFLLPQSLQNTIQKFEPSSLGSSMMSLVPKSEMFGAWTAFGVLLIYVVVLLGIGITMFQRRDA